MSQEKIQQEAALLGVKIYESCGQSIFRIYGPSSGISSSHCIILYLEGFATPVRMNGGEFPIPGEIVIDPDGWTYCCLKFSDEKMLFCLMQSAAKSMKEMQQSRGFVPSIYDRTRAFVHRVSFKIQKMRAA